MKRAEDEADRLQAEQSEAAQRIAEDTRGTYDALKQAAGQMRDAVKNLHQIEHHIGQQTMKRMAKTAGDHRR